MYDVKRRCFIEGLNTIKLIVFRPSMKVNSKKDHDLLIHIAEMLKGYVKMVNLFLKKEQ